MGGLDTRNTYIQSCPPIPDATAPSFQAYSSGLQTRAFARFKRRLFFCCSVAASSPVCQFSPSPHLYTSIMQAEGAFFVAHLCSGLGPRSRWCACGTGGFVHLKVRYRQPGGQHVILKGGQLSFPPRIAARSVTKPHNLCRLLRVSLLASCTGHRSRESELTTLFCSRDIALCHRHHPVLLETARQPRPRSHPRWRSRKPRQQEER